MEARPWSDGSTVTYRFHPLGGKPINLGTDRTAALQKVLDLTGRSDDTGTISRLWEQYKDSPKWKGLRERTQADYIDYSGPLLRVFGDVQAAHITAPDVSRYLTVERAEAPVRANREVALLGNLIALAIKRGEATHNPCRGRQVERNTERPRNSPPNTDDIRAIIAHAQAKGGQWRVIVMAAEFASLVGSRQAEFLSLYWPQWTTEEVRLRRAKQRKGVEKVERIESSPGLLDLRARVQEIARDGKVGTVFPNRHGNPYTAEGFASMWGKLMREAVKEKVVGRRFTFHDLRTYYTTQHTQRLGALPDLHASPTTTARVYDGSRERRRKAL